MTALSNAVSSGKLALKQREAKKVLDRSEQIVSRQFTRKNSRRSKKDEGGRTTSVYSMRNCITSETNENLKQKGRTNHVHQKQLKAELQRMIEIEKKANEQISSMTKEIEEFCSKMTGEASENTVL